MLRRLQLLLLAVCVYCVLFYLSLFEFFIFFLGFFIFIFYFCITLFLVVWLCGSCPILFCSVDSSGFYVLPGFLPATTARVLAPTTTKFFAHDICVFRFNASSTLFLTRIPNEFAFWPIDNDRLFSKRKSVFGVWGEGRHWRRRKAETYCYQKRHLGARGCWFSCAFIFVLSELESFFPLFVLPGFGFGVRKESRLRDEQGHFYVSL